jgi:hypothetical protein
MDDGDGQGPDHQQIELNERMLKQILSHGSASSSQVAWQRTAPGSRRQGGLPGQS